MKISSGEADRNIVPDRAVTSDLSRVKPASRHDGAQVAAAARKYQRTGNTIIRPLLFKTDIPAFDLARAWYEQFRDDPDPRRRLVFEDDLLDYSRHGFVCIRPHLFALAKVVEHEGERIWFLRICIGDLLELVQVMPFRLEKICFCRENQPDSMRIVRWDAFLRKIGVLYGFTKRAA